MAIEQRLAEAIRSFHLDPLSSSVALDANLDATLTAWAHATYDLLRRHLAGYHQATPDTIWRRLVFTRERITITPDHITAKLNHRTYSPVLRTAQLPPVTIPWWHHHTLTIEIGEPNPTSRTISCTRIQADRRLGSITSGTTAHREAAAPGPELGPSPRRPRPLSSRRT